MANLFGRGLQQQVPVLLVGAAIAPGLKEILKHDAKFTLDAANGLLQHLREHRIWLFNANRVLQFLIVIVHTISYIEVSYVRELS
jgi:hypothetical protein